LLCKGEAPIPKGQKAPMKRLAAIIAPWLEAQIPAAIAWGERMLAHAHGNIAKDGDSEPDFDMGELFDDVAAELSAAAVNALQDVGGAVGVDLTTAPEAAIQFARERGALLVGKRIVNGTIIDNPNGMFSVSDTLRGMIRDRVAQSISEGWSPQELASSLRDQFGDWRAETIARTETGYAYNNAAAEGYRELGVEYLEIVDGDGCLPDGHDDTAGTPSGEPGVIEDDAEADGQVWTVDQFQEHPLGHPNCVRGAVPAAVEEGE
jgi:hypothetical protein